MHGDSNSQSCAARGSNAPHHQPPPPHPVTGTNPAPNQNPHEHTPPKAAQPPGQRHDESSVGLVPRVRWAMPAKRSHRKPSQPPTALIHKASRRAPRPPIGTPSGKKSHRDSTCSLPEVVIAPRRRRTPLSPTHPNQRTPTLLSAPNRTIPSPRRINPHRHAACRAASNSPGRRPGSASKTGRGPVGAVHRSPRHRPHRHNPHLAPHHPENPSRPSTVNGPYRAGAHWGHMTLGFAQG